MNGAIKYPGAQDTTASAREIIDAEKAKRGAKTARLQEARLAKEASDPAKPTKPKPRAKPKWQR
jgi:hypothetical protein